MDWRLLQDPKNLERYVATELARGHLPGRLRLALMDMGIDGDRARDVIEAIADEGPRAVLRRHRGPRGRRIALAVGLIAVGIGAIVFAATLVDQDNTRWYVFATTGAGLLTSAFGLQMVTR